MFRVYKNLLGNFNRKDRTFTVEASTLGFQPGYWPRTLVAVSDDGSALVFSRFDLPLEGDAGFEYVDLAHNLEVVVYND